MDLQIDPIANMTAGPENGKVGFTTDDYQYFKRVYEYNPGATAEEVINQVHRETNVARSVILAEIQRLDEAKAQPESEPPAAPKKKRGRPPKAKAED